MLPLLATIFKIWGVNFTVYNRLRLISAQLSLASFNEISTFGPKGSCNDITVYQSIVVIHAVSNLYYLNQEEFQLVWSNGNDLVLGELSQLSGVYRIVLQSRRQCLWMIILKVLFAGRKYTNEQFHDQ